MKNDKIKKIAIFGGSFDPPHYGHVDIVKNLEKTFDNVIVMPTYASPFKCAEATDAAVRFKLCKKLFSSEKTEVSRREISRKCVSYSVDTAAYFAKKEDGAQLYWVIGSEELKRLCEWHKIDELKTLVTFFVVPRPEFEIDAELIKTLKKRKIKIKIAKFNGLDISSTQIKIDNAFGMHNKFVPSEVYGYARKNGLFDPYSHLVEKLKEHGLSERRIMHTYRTALRGAELAKLYGASVHDAVVACIVHDIAKNADVDKYKDKTDISAFPPPTVHSPIGAYIVKNELGLSDEIAHAVLTHSTADSDMSVLDEIVYLADKTESGRNYASFAHMRYLCGIDRHVAMYAALLEISKLRETVDCAYTSRALEYYGKLCSGREIPKIPNDDRASSNIADRSATLPVVRKKGEISAAKSKAVRTVPDKSVRAVQDKSVSAHFTNARKNNEDASDKHIDEVKDIAFTVAKELSDHKARDIDVIDLVGKTIVADYFVIASASSTTAVKALYGYVEDKLTKKFGIDPNKRDLNSDWVALDYGSVIVHIFTDKTREFYNIERLWSDGDNVTRYGE